VEIADVIRAGVLGIIAASGLLLGAVAGLVLKPSQKVVAVLMAFGAGTLLAAMSFDLCEHAFEMGGPGLLIAGFLAGGFLFVAAETLVDERGGFLRREGTRARFLQHKKAERDREVLARLSEVELLRALPPAEAQAIVPYVEERKYEAGETIFAKGDEGDALYLIAEGEAGVLDGERELARLRAGAAFGEMALLTGEPRNATVKTLGPLRAYRIGRDDFNHLLTHSPRLASVVQRLLAERLAARASRGPGNAETWRRVATAHLSRQLTAHEERALLEEHAGKHAPIAIYIGALVDGVPESIVIGATLVGSSSPSLSFLVAVFLSNFPEAMSSATGMTRAGFSAKRVMLMWGSLVVIAGLSAAAGNAFLATAPKGVLAFAESFAAGGILALLANTLMPEAFELGGRLTAFSTIVGFLAAFLISVM
jgi:CRP-like cAMP-binding protein